MMVAPAVNGDKRAVRAQSLRHESGPDRGTDFIFIYFGYTCDDDAGKFDIFI